MSCFLSKFCNHRSLGLLNKLPSHTVRTSLGNRIYFHRRKIQESSNLFYPTLFTLSVSSGAIVIASICEYERHASAGFKFNGIKEFVKHSSYKTSNWTGLNRLWDDLKVSEKLFAAILSLNVLVFLAWQIPSYHPILYKYFTTNALARKIPVSSLLLSAFSHESPVHLFFNMVALHSFCCGVIQPWGSMSPEEFTAMYLGSCVVSSLTSIIYRRSFGLVGHSLGASGAILSVVAYFAVTHPYQKLSIIFIPGIEFDAIKGLGGLMTLDSLGLIFKWQTFDHAAHLGGAMFGILWHKWVSKNIWENKKYIVKKWIQLKMITKKFLGGQR
ncbi:presenilins-associated rhomboid-like protein, mitochondrial isoform X1 [Adelges cooleyi]|uniref:presenilins-associated rhomboid-like protein, mitochondrial isoform X1 n=1 Tax=Adelges cooleyi TaxID=133065 RepID=UPI0021809532|nr:presenilins-associated rhomboid-like protein, mitochondrial isoform X1 [Adelges cooleyi]